MYFVMPDGLEYWLSIILGHWAALQPVKIAVLLAFLCWAWRKEEGEVAYLLLWPSYICLSQFSTNQVEMITQETNPVYWACTHCLTLEPWTVIISTFILVVQFDNTIRFATLESVRPGLTAKGSFKNSKSKGRNLFIHHLCEIFHFIVKCVTGKCNMTAVI